MKLFAKKTFEQIMETSLSRLSNTPISEVGPGGVARLLLGAINEELATLYETLEINYTRAFLSSATGEFLDAIGMLLNCDRLPFETDDTYRYRISNQTLSAVTGNETAIRIAALSVPGVRDIITKPYTHGTGSFSLYVITDELEPKQELLNAVSAAVESVKSQGVKAHIFTPRLIPVELTIKLLFKKQTTDIERNLAITTTIQKLKGYINSRTAGEALIVNEMTSIIMETSELIFDFQMTNFYVNNRPVLWVNQEARWDERFIQSTRPNSIVVS